MGLTQTEGGRQRLTKAFLVVKEDLLGAQGFLKVFKTVNS